MTLTFPVVTCSQCGKAFAGPRPSGFSHCHQHKRLRVLTHQEEYAMRQQKPDPRDPDYSREGIFQNHNCYRCEHGKMPCVRGGNPAKCEHPHARND